MQIGLMFNCNFMSTGRHSGWQVPPSHPWLRPSPASEFQNYNQKKSDRRYALNNAVFHTTSTDVFSPATLSGAQYS